MAQQHGAVAGRAVPGTGNASAVEAQQQADLGDPDTDLIGTWRICPPAPDEAENWRRQYDLTTPRAVKVGAFAWRLVDLDDRMRDALSPDLDGDEVQTWPYTPTVAVGAAARLHHRRTHGGPEPERALPTIVEGDEGEYLFRGPR